jgi:hypothetical protein
MPKMLRDTEKDCGKPGCPNDPRSQVLAHGDEVIERVDFRNRHKADLRSALSDVRCW